MNFKLRMDLLKKSVRNAGTFFTTQSKSLRGVARNEAKQTH